MDVLPFFIVMIILAIAYFYTHARLLHEQNVRSRAETELMISERRAVSMQRIIDEQVERANRTRERESSYSRWDPINAQATRIDEDMMRVARQSIQNILGEPDTRNTASRPARITRGSNSGTLGDKLDSNDVENSKESLQEEKTQPSDKLDFLFEGDNG